MLDRIVESSRQIQQPCSGSLVAPTVFLTAAHCLAFIESVGATQVWVTFDSEADVQAPTLIPGFPHPNPAFDSHAPDPNDVAVITLLSPVVGTAPLQLPTPGLIDELGERNGLKYQSFIVVGYGVNQRTVGDGPPVLIRDLDRRYASSDLNAVEGALLRLSKLAAHDDGGASKGDSGGPILLGNSNTAAAIVGMRASQGMYTGYRLDIPSARAFLSAFVTLPN